MHHFQYRQDELYCEDVPISDIARAVGTPCYVYSHATLKRHLSNFDAAFKDVERLICYSAKANTNLAILNLFATLGCGLDIVSGGELHRGLQAGFSPQKIVYSGVGKTAAEIDFALQSGILMFNVESLAELDLINQRAQELQIRAPVAMRVNPNVDPRTHPYVSTGLKKNKFGINMAEALEGYRLADKLDTIDIVGIDCHIGSQITDLKPFAEALASLIDLIQQVEQIGVKIRYLDMGGGLGITYHAETPPSLNAYADVIATELQGTGLKLILEPGRVLVGNAGVLVTRVLFRKPGENKNFLIVDAGMNDLLRPTLYEAFHAIQPVVKADTDQITADVVGPICESGDFLALDRRLPSVAKGQLLAVMSAGAYGFVMSSNYCSRPRAAEVMVKGDRFEVVRQRETYQDLIKGESIPGFLKSE